MDIEELLNKKLKWFEVLPSNHRFFTQYEGRECILQMNDFPEEPLYTLFYEEKSIDFDDKPIEWELPEIDF